MPTVLRQLRCLGMLHPNPNPNPTVNPNPTLNPNPNPNAAQAHVSQLASSVPQATKPLLRQIAALQAQQQNGCSIM